MRNFVAEGNTVNVTAPTGGMTAGKCYLFGTSLFGVSPVDAAAGDTVALWTQGVYTLDKATGTAWTVGIALYWDNSAKKVTTVSTSNTKIGTATKAAASGDGTGEVRLNGIAFPSAF